MTWLRQASACMAVAVVLLICVPPIQAQRAGGEPRVLLVHSYDPDMRWTTELTAGLREGLVARFPEVSLHVEYLQLDPVAADEAGDRLARRLRQKHRDVQFHLAVVADDAAYQFILECHDTVIPGVPVVFCGVSEFSPAVLRRHQLLTGILQLPDLSRPLRTALLRGQTLRRLLVIHDGTPAGIAYRRQVQEMLPELLSRQPDLRVVFLSGTDLSTPEMLERVRLAPLDALILFTVWYQGADGDLLPHDEILPEVSRVSPVPVYSVTRLKTEFDTSRERLLVAFRQGRAAADIAAKILRGVPPSEIPVAIMTESEGADESAPWHRRAPLYPESPGDSRSISPWGISFASVLAVAIAFQLAIIVFLFATIARRRRAQNAWVASRQRLELVIDSLGLGIFEWNISTGYYEINSHYADMLGFLPDEIGKQLEDWKRLVHPDDLERVLEALSDYLEDRSTHYHVRYRMQTAAGSYRWILARGEVIERDRNGTPIRMVGTHLPVDGLDPNGEENPGPGD